MTDSQYTFDYPMLLTLFKFNFTSMKGSLKVSELHEWENSNLYLDGDNDNKMFNCVTLNA